MRYYISISNLAFLLVFIVVCFSCSNSSDIDQDKPTIDISTENASPMNCDEFVLGGEITVKVTLRDNVELSKYTISIHNNFNHHSHSTEFETCTLEPKKDAINPFYFVDDYEIPEDKQSYEVNLTIPLQASNDKGDYDDGDYHFSIKLTDAEGWSTLKGLSIKLKRK